jgi:hypothetical protein
MKNTNTYKKLIKIKTPANAGIFNIGLLVSDG